MKDRDLGWIAGFMEGEGSFTFHQRCLLMSAGQVQREPLERLHQLMGGNISMKPRAEKAPWYQWNLATTETAAWMMTLYGLMSPRRKAQIAAALAIWRTKKPKNWRKFSTHCKRGHAFSVENTKILKNGGRNCRECLRMLWRRKHLRLVNE